MRLLLRRQGHLGRGRAATISDQPVEIRVGDVVRLRKPHPCGSYEWRVVRIGADIGITCSGCGRRVLLPRRLFLRQVKQFISRAGAGEPHPEGRGAHGP